MSKQIKVRNRGGSWLQAQQGFTAAEKVLVGVVALGLILLVTKIILSGSEQAAERARAALSGQASGGVEAGAKTDVVNVAVVTTGEQTAQWADNEYQRRPQDPRFFNSTTHGFGEWVKYDLFGNGYAKCNQFVAAAYTEGGKYPYPSVDGRPPVVSELADPKRFTDRLSYSTNPDTVHVGDIALWYDEKKGTHHSAIISGFDKNGQPTVTYAGAGEVIKQRPMSEVTDIFGVKPVFRGPK